MDYDFYPEERPRRRVASGMLLVLAVLVGWLSLADGPARAMSTTTVSAAAYTYDAPTVARVDIHAFRAADASPFQRSGSREGTASPQVGDLGRLRPPLLEVLPQTPSTMRWLVFVLRGRRVRLRLGL